MLDFNDPITQVIFVFGLSVLVFLLIFILGRSKEKTIALLKEKVDEQAQKIETLKTKLTNSEEKLFQQGATTKSTSFVHEQIKKIEELESEVVLYKKRLEEAKVIAQEANMVKYDFLSNIRHEVRTPMNSILVFADMLRAEIKDATQRSYANNIFTSGHKLLELMDKIIELSHLESGSFQLNEKAVDSHLLFETIVDSQKSKAYKKAIAIKLIIDEDVPQSLVLDDEKVQEIVNNLLDNAIKFTKQGHVKIHVKVSDSNIINNTINLSISVEDTGMGIDEENQKRIFEIFEKREDCNEIEFQGTGLGLSLNRKMARHMNGDISVKSKEGKGSIFTLSLKNIEIVLSSDENISEEDIDFSLINSAKLMVIAQAEENRAVISKSFEETENEILYFNNPRSAIESLKETSVDLIFMDVDLLEIDDGAVSKVMANISKAPVVSLTNKSLKNIDFVSNGLKVVGHLKKPISKVELFKVCIKVLNSSHLLNKSSSAIQESTVFDNVDINKAKNFLLESAQEIAEVYKSAYSTHDLNQTKQFADLLMKLAMKYQLDYFVNYANDLIKKIELFDIDAIEKLMENYNELINILKKKAK